MHLGNGNGGGRGDEADSLFLCVFVGSGLAIDESLAVEISFLRLTIFVQVLRICIYTAMNI